MIRGCDTLVSEFQELYIMSGMNVDVSKNRDSSQLDMIFLRTGLRGITECKDYRYLDEVSRFVFGYADTWMGFEDNAPLSKINVQNTERSNRMMSEKHSKGWSTKDLDDMRNSVSTFKKAVWDLFWSSLWPQSEHSQVSYFGSSF